MSGCGEVSTDTTAHPWPRWIPDGDCIICSRRHNKQVTQDACAAPVRCDNDSQEPLADLQISEALALCASQQEARRRPTGRQPETTNT